MTGETAVLAPGDVLRAGEHVQLADGAALRVVTPLGDRLRLNGPATLVIGGQKKPGVVSVEYDGGALDFVAAAAGTLVLDCGHGTITCEAGSVVARWVDGHVLVETRVPSVEVTADGPPRAVDVGAPLTL